MKVEITKSKRTGIRLESGSKYIWINQKPGPEFKRLYMYAELIDSHYTNHKEFDSLEDAIMHMINN